MDAIYQNFYTEIKSRIPKERLIRDTLRRNVWGTDAGFYKLVPELVVFAETFEEVKLCINSAKKYNISITFRAAGTSLSGQAISDSVLIVISKGWDKLSFKDDGALIEVGPGQTVASVNQKLAKFKRQLGPDPASSTAAFIGGAISNNASGMSCGVHNNSDQIIQSVKILLADGNFLDTSDAKSKEDFAKKHSPLLEELTAIRKEIMSNPVVNERIKKKYSIKNVVGLNLLPFIRYEDPFDLITHLMVGSEGTLAFLGEAVLKTQEIKKESAIAIIYFENIIDACNMVQFFDKQCVYKCELLDRKALASVEGRDDVPKEIKTLPKRACALLVECAGATKEEVLKQTNEIEKEGDKGIYKPLFPIKFTDDKALAKIIWNIRAGIFPAVGGRREKGTTCMIEDVAFPISELPSALEDLRVMLDKYRYDDAVIYGHALQGNVHFIINQMLHTKKDIEKYESLMEEVAELVITKYDGSLKAEHGTGRNMAPYLVKEWGEECVDFMKRVKKAFDPDNIFNRGVIFNDNAQCHIENLKVEPLVLPLIDNCIECGFCEPKCVAHNFTFSPRQRIIAQRVMKSHEKDVVLHKEMQRQYKYLGNETCAVDGLCATACPMGINTAHLTYHLKSQKKRGYKIALWASRNFKRAKGIIRFGLGFCNIFHRILGSSIMLFLCKGVRFLSFKTIPLWTPSMPRPFYFKKEKFDALAVKINNNSKKVVYFPSCVNQTMGLSYPNKQKKTVVETFYNLCEKAKYEIVLPNELENFCCGTIWQSKGMETIAYDKFKELYDALMIVSENGRYPIVFDQSPCVYRFLTEVKRLNLSLKVLDSVLFVEKYLASELDFKQLDEAIVVHYTCSSQKMNIEGNILSLLQRCSSNVLVPEGVNCCGFSGDKGFTLPELNKHGLRKLPEQIKNSDVTITRGFSNSTTCEVGLSTNTKIPYYGVIFLVDEVTSAKG